MYPFIFNNPFGPFPFAPFARRTNIPRLDNRGIPEICTTGIQENSGVAGVEDSVDYGINPRVWKALPNQCIILWKVRHSVSQAGADLPANVVVPTSSSSSTVSTPSSTTGTKKVSIVDNKSNQVTGGDISTPTGTGTATQQGYTTEHIVYIDKCTGIFRLLGVTAATTAAPTA